MVIEGFWVRARIDGGMAVFPKEKWPKNITKMAKKRFFVILITPIFVHFLPFYFAKTDFFIFCTVLSDGIRYLPKCAPTRNLP